MIVVGLDLSLTSTGIARVDPETGEVTVSRVLSKGRKDATLDDRHARLHNLRIEICLQIVNADLVVIEGPSLGQARQGGQHDRAGLWWLVVDWLMEIQAKRVVEVSPASRSKYATGKGNAAKDAVLAAVVRRYPQVDVSGNDEADALVLAAMGARHCGYPIDTLPKTHLVAMDAVAWPEVARADQVLHVMSCDECGADLDARPHFIGYTTEVAP